MPQSKKPKMRAIIGVIVTEPLGTPSIHRNPLIGFSFAPLIFDGQEPWGLDMTVTLESETVDRTASEGLEIVSGTVENMRNTLATLVGARQESPQVAASADRPKDAPTTIIQLCVGSLPFADLFAQVMAKLLPINVDRWLECFRSEVRGSNVDDVVWVDMLNPDELRKVQTREMMREAISHMVA